jgi:lipopolysaccharide/colanic/teichoic acid biosynthesis glycosyltransferase
MEPVVWENALNVKLNEFSVRAGLYQPVKAAGEFCATCALAMLALPVIAVLAILVKCASPGPAFYSQMRLGLSGRPFRIWKLRTMSHNCEAITGPVWCSENDPRVTPLGRVLRDTHLDELPQLWNVLRGEMSLIGPRPERPEIARGIEAAIPGFNLRLLIKPGLTGLAQLRHPPDQDIAAVPHKLAQDLYYLRHQGPLLDLRILISTAFHFIGGGCVCVSKLLLGEAVPSAPHELEQLTRQSEPAELSFDSPMKPQMSELPAELSAAA